MDNNIRKQIESVKQLADNKIKPMNTENTEIRLTDQSNAEMIADLYGDKIRYDHKLRRWLLWNGNMWKPDDDGTIYEYAVQAARKRYIEATNIVDSALKKKTAEWAIKSESRVGIEATLGLLKNTKPVADNGKNWDKNPMLLGCRNGVIDLSTGVFRKGKPEDRITMSTGIDFDPLATCPRFTQFLDEIFLGDKELIHFLHKSFGYSTQGSVSEEFFFIGHGDGRNGKSKLFGAIQDALGEYAQTIPSDSLKSYKAQSGAAHQSDITRMEKRRFAVSSEAVEFGKLNTERIKQLTGNDKVSARAAYEKDATEFEATIKLWIFTNKKPIVQDTSKGFWEKVGLIPFNRYFTRDERDLHLKDKLAAEAPGILNWLIEGCLLWQNETLAPIPAKVSEATREYEIDQDQVGEFLSQRIIDSPEGKMTNPELYSLYKSWCIEQGMSEREIGGPQAFHMKMTTRKYIKGKVRGNRGYLGLAANPLINVDNSENTDNLDTLGHLASLNGTPSDPFYMTSLHESNIAEVYKKTPLSVPQPQKSVPFAGLEDYIEQAEENL